MAAPYDYTALVGGFQSPQEAFIGSIKTVEALRSQRKAQEDAQRMQIDVQDYMTAPNPQKLANLHLRYPSMKESLNAYTQTLSDADKRTTTEFATQAFGLNRAGRTEDVLSLFDRYITAAKESGRPDMARVLGDAKTTFQKIERPEQREALIGSVLAGTGEEGLNIYEKVWSAPSGEKPTSFQQDFDFIKKTFGDAAAAEFAQFGRSGIVSIPLGDGRTYVGPPSMAPGASRWQQQQGAAPAPTGQQPETVTPEGAASILGNASRSSRITQAEANVVRQSLGPQGQAQFNKWLTDNSIKIIVRTGTTPDGRRVVQFQDGTVEYGD